jgi:type III pantothenate kinase
VSAGGPVLLLDVGNTRLKWAVAGNGKIGTAGAIVHDGKPAQALAQLDLDDPPDAIKVVSVAGPAHELAIDETCLARWHRPARHARSEAGRDGLHNGYAQPQRLGADRWIAMLAAWHLAGRSAFVVADAGTALTVDVVGANGRHLGGIIAAGLQTSEKAVLGATRFPTRDTSLADHAGLGFDTEACVRQGAMLSVIGAIERAAAVAPANALRVLTGGDASRLAPHLAGRWALRPHLVLEGLQVLPDA